MEPTPLFQEHLKSRSGHTRRQSSLRAGACGRAPVQERFAVMCMPGRGGKRTEGKDYPVISQRHRPPGAEAAELSCCWHSARAESEFGPWFVNQSAQASLSGKRDQAAKHCGCSPDTQQHQSDWLRTAVTLPSCVSCFLQVPGSRGRGEAVRPPWLGPLQHQTRRRCTKRDSDKNNDDTVHFPTHKPRSVSL